MLFAEGIEVGAIYIFAILGGSGAVIAFLFKLLISSKDREYTLLVAQKDKAIADLDSQKKSYQEIAGEALKSATETANYYRAREGKPPIIPAAAVVPESHSPPTLEQSEAAAIQTLRAKMAQVKLATGQEPRLPYEPLKSADSPPVVTLLDAVNLKEEIARVPEKTAEKVIEKLEEKDTTRPQES